MSGEETHSKSSQARLLDEPEAISSSKKRVVLKVPLFVLMHRNTFLLAFEFLGHGCSCTAAVAHGEDYGSTATHDIATGIDGGDV